MFTLKTRHSSLYPLNQARLTTKSQTRYEIIDNVRPSILSQLTTIQRKKLWNGKIETRVVLKNRFTDGKEEEKIVVNDASKVLEEVERMYVFPGSIFPILNRALIL